MKGKKEPAALRFIRFFSWGPKENCWLWTGARHGRPGKLYGRFSENRENVMAHNYSYRLFVGDIPKGYEVHHLCEIPLCVNPYHLQLLTKSEHSSIPRTPKKEFCHRGHRMVGWNVIVMKSGSRACRQCHYDRGFMYRRGLLAKNIKKGEVYA